MLEIYFTDEAKEDLKKQNIEIIAIFKNKNLF
jgi:hypothetical protein